MANEHGPFTEKYKKELISRAQLDELLLRFGWLPHHIDRDLGEDFLVHIYDKGRWSGLSFYIQLKATDDIERYRLNTEDCVSYEVEVRHLLRWEGSGELVIFILWDIERRTGLWDIIQRVAPILDEQNPMWRGQGNVNIRLPDRNELDFDNLRELRRIVAEHTYPIISKGRSLDLKVNLRIPYTPEGQDFLNQLKAFYARGGEITIPPEFISELATSDWHQRLFGKVIFSSEYPILVASREADTSTVHRFDIVSPDGEHAILPYVEMKVIRRGDEEVTLSNKHQHAPFHFTWTFYLLTNGLSIRMELVGPGANVQDTLDAIRFLRIAGKPGSRMIFKTHGSSQPPIVLDSPPEIHHRGVNDEFEALVEKLCHIQYKTGVMFALKDLGLEGEDIKAIEEVYTIVTTGKLQLDGVECAPMLSRELVEIAFNAQKAGMGMRYSTKGAKSQQTILGVTVQLGLADWTIVSAVPKLSVEELQTILDGMSIDDTREIPIVVYEGIAEFHEWAK